MAAAAVASCASALPSESPPSAGLIATLWAWTQYSLQNHLHENAIFLAERIAAEQPSEAASSGTTAIMMQKGTCNFGDQLRRTFA